jgi:hypothetical protein
MQIGPQEEYLIQYIGKARLNKKVPERVKSGGTYFVYGKTHLKL